MFEDCLKTRPETVAIVAMGRSNMDYVTAMMDKHRVGPIADEVWVVNKAWDVFRHDKCFMMDDVQFHMARRYPYFGEILKRSKTPIITSTPYPEWPATVAYPLEEVVADIGETYLTNTVPYMLAYAIHIGVKQVLLFGADYWYPQNQAEERGKDCLEFWIGIAKMRGVQIAYANTSTLMDNVFRTSDDEELKRRYLYGYVNKPQFSRNKETGRLFIKGWGNETDDSKPDGDGVEQLDTRKLA